MTIGALFTSFTPRALCDPSAENWVEDKNPAMDMIPALLLTAAILECLQWDLCSMQHTLTAARGDYRVFPSKSHESYEYDGAFLTTCEHFKWNTLCCTHTTSLSLNKCWDWRFTVWQISGVNSDLRGARGANKLFWKLNLITMLMLLLINQAGNWPRIIRTRGLLIGCQVTTSASYWSVRADVDLRDSNDSWENEK